MKLKVDVAEFKPTCIKEIVSMDFVKDLINAREEMLQICKEDPEEEDSANY